MARLFSLLLFLTIIIVAFMSLKPDSEQTAKLIEGLPWQIEVLPDGYSRVFGITLGQSTLADAREQLGGDMQLAIVVASGQEIGGLEMFYRRYKAGVFSGKLVLAADLPPEQLTQLMEGAIKAKYMESGARKFTLHPDDLPMAFQAPVATITFIPVVKIDEASAIKRFGPATETLHTSEQLTHLLYPDKGLDLITNENGKAILQYVAPRDFWRLREPLQ